MQYEHSELDHDVFDFDLHSFSVSFFGRGGA